MIDYKYFFNNFSKAIILSDYKTGRIVDINEEALSFFCRSTEDFNNLKRTDIFPLKAIKDLNLQLDKTDNSNPASTDSFIINKEGNKIPVHIDTRVLKENGTVLLIETISGNNDTATAKNVLTVPEKLLNKNEDKYKTLFDNANDAIFLVKDESIVDLNSKALEMFRCTKEQIVAKTIYDLSPEYQPDGSKSIIATKETNEKVLNAQPQFFEWRLQRPDNSLFDAEVSLNSVTLDDKTYIQAIVRDISERKQIELDLIETKISLSSLLKNLPGMAYRCKNDKDWTMEFVSEGCFNLTGYRASELVNNKDLSYADLIHPEDKTMVWDSVQNAIKEKKSFQLIYRISTSNNEMKWVWEQGNGVFSEDGRLLALEGLINDITEQKSTEEALQQSESKFRSLVEESLAGVYIIQDGKFSYVNPRAAEIFGYTTDEILSGKTIVDLAYEKDLNIVQENIRKRLDGEIKSMHYSFRGKKKDNTIIDVEVIGSKTIYDGLPAVIGTVLNVTERNKTDRELRKLSSAVEQSPASIIITDAEGNIEYVNPKFCEITGYLQEEVLGKNPRILKYGTYPEGFYKNLWGTVKSGREWRGEFHNKKKNGELYWEYGVISPIKNSDGEIINFIAIKEDITERKKTDWELRKLSRAVEQSSASIIITDTGGNIEYVNPKFCELTGYSSDEVLGRKPKILEHALSTSSNLKDLWNTIKQGDEWRGEFLNRKKNGESFWEFASISPIKNSEGKTTNYLLIKEDITKRKEAEGELQLAKKRAEEMNKLKSIFLANMSHELRTPMVAILGYSDVLRKELENPNLLEMSQEIYDSSRRLMNTLNLLLDLSRIEANKAVINYAEIDVSAIAAEEFGVYQSMAKNKNLQFETDLPDEPIVTLLDERMLRQIVNNLTSNAVKFTNKGNVRLTVKKELRVEKENIIIQISDTGIGIPKSSQKIIFEAFRQISEGFNRDFEGAGLGLTITKKFVEMLNGEIEIESELGRGATFTIKFPIVSKTDVKMFNSNNDKPSQVQIEFPKEKSAHTLSRILLIEDDQSNIGVIKHFLEDLYEVDVAFTGEEGYNMAKAKKYKAILMDIDLGEGISGLQTARKIKTLPNYNNQPIIAVTALVMRGDRERFLSEGCSHYLAKPFKKEELIKIISDALKG